MRPRCHIHLRASRWSCLFFGFALFVSRLSMQRREEKEKGEGNAIHHACILDAMCTLGYCCCRCCILDSDSGPVSTRLVDTFTYRITYQCSNCLFTLSGRDETRSERTTLLFPCPFPPHKQTPFEQKGGSSRDSCTHTQCLWSTSTLPLVQPTASSVNVFVIR